jgi:hypothetical protein
MPEQAPLIPFRYGTRQRFKKVGVIPFTAFGDGFQLSKPFPEVGLINEVYLQFRGTITIGAAGIVYGDNGPWALLKRLKINLNLGSLSIVDVSGFGAFLASATREQGARSDKAGSGDTTPDADIFAAPVAVGAFPFVLTLVIPVAANDNENFQFGMINLQAPQVQLMLEGSWGTAAELVTVPADLTSVAGSLHIGYTYFEVPNPNQVELPPVMLHRIVEESQPIASVGEQIFTLQRQGSLLQLWHIVRLNGARNNADVEKFTMVVNNVDTLYEYERQFMKLKQRFNFQQEWPAGCFLWDFWASQTGVSNGDTRDTINTEAISLLESRVTIASAAVLGVGNNNLVSVRRILQQLAA